MDFQFDDATALDDLGRGRFSGRIHEGWDINGNANGGYLLALIAAAMRITSSRPDPISVTGHFMAPGRPGRIALETALIKSGRQLATVTATMRDGDREILRAIGTFGDVGALGGGYEHVTRTPPDLPDSEHCVLRSVDQGIVTVALMNKLRVALRPEHAGFAQGAGSGVGLIEGWASFVDDRPIDTLSLLLLVDAFPPPIFNLDAPTGWVPTVELTAHIRGLPSPGPVRCRFSSEVIQNGFLQEDAEIWDSAGQLVAQSRQLALLPRG